MKANYNEYQKYTTEAEAAPAMTDADILAVAVAEEYKIFSANKVITTYRRGMAFLMAQVKKETDAWRLHQSFRDYQPDKEGEEEVPRKAANPGFQTATELLRSKRDSSDEDEVAAKLPKGKAAAGFGSKRDPLTQTAITSFTSAGAFQSALELSNKNQELRRSTSTASESSSTVREGTRRKWKSLGLSDDSGDEEAGAGKAPAAPPPDKGLNFYCDISPSPSSSSPELSDAEEQVATAAAAEPLEEENGQLDNGEPEQRSDEGDDLSDVEALVLRETEQEIAVEERIREEYRVAEEAAAERKSARAAARAEAAADPDPMQGIVYCEGEEEKVTEIQDEIQKLQQKMDEGQRNMREEMKAREERERLERRRRQEREETEERKRRQERREREQLKSPHKKKIRVRVEQGGHSIDFLGPFKLSIFQGWDG